MSKSQHSKNKVERSLEKVPKILGNKMDFLRAGIKSVVGSQESQTNQANGIETVSIM